MKRAGCPCRIDFSPPNTTHHRDRKIHLRQPLAFFGDHLIKELGRLTDCIRPYVIRCYRPTFASENQLPPEMVSADLLHVVKLECGALAFDLDLFRDRPVQEIFCVVRRIGKDYGHFSADLTGVQQAASSPFSKDSLRETRPEPLDANSFSFLPSTMVEIQKVYNRCFMRASKSVAGLLKRDDGATNRAPSERLRAGPISGLRTRHLRSELGWPTVSDFSRAE